MDFSHKICHTYGMESRKNLAVLSRKELEKEYVQLSEKLASAQAKLTWYEEQYKLSKSRRFGRSSEADIAGQISLEDLALFNEAEALIEPINTEPKEEELLPSKTKKRKKKNLRSLPVQEHIYELSPEEQLCPTCGELLHEMKREVRFDIEVVPAKVHVNKYISAVYACRNCEKNGTATIIKAPGAPAPLIEKSPASASLLSAILTKKYVDAVPFYRQEKTLKARCIPVTRNNMCHWSIRVAFDYFKPVTDKMQDILYREGVLHCDETYVQVLSEPDRPATGKSYIWVRTTPKYKKDQPIALYNYTETRSAADARKVLAGYRGYIMCDGYTVYDALSKTGKHGEPPMDVKPVACMVHVRRKFAEALKLLRPQDRKDSSAQKAIELLSVIFKIDNQFDDLSPAERKKLREERLRKPLEEFFAWVRSESEISLPKTRYGQALEYALKQKEKVMRVFEDGRLELENNTAEQAVKPFVIGRKNWMFAQTPQGAEASCIIYSIVETAKRNNLVPYEYMKYLLEQMPGIPLTDENLEKLMPWSNCIPSYVKNPEE